MASFRERAYQVVPWKDHLAVFLADRARWKDLLALSDRRKLGKVNGKEHSIEDLTGRLVSHEHHHLFTPR